MQNISEEILPCDIVISDEVRRYIISKDMDFRICTSCGGPIILSTLAKPPKESDLKISIGNHILFVSIYQAKYLGEVTMDMFPKYSDYV